MWVCTREDCLDMSSSQQKGFISWLVATLSLQDPSVALSLSQGELLSTKPISWVDIFQLTRTASQKQKQESKVSAPRGFPRAVALMD